MASIDKLLQLVNTHNSPSKPLSASNVTVAEVAAEAGTGYNTRVKLQAIEGVDYVSSVDVFYRRIDLAQVQDDSGLISDVPFTPELIVQKINDNWATWLTVDDIVPFTIPDLSDGEVHDVILTAKADSLYWFGSVSISLVEADVVNPLYTMLNVTMPSNGYI